jgi:predicted GIY-YIG superfamily endonuclease
MLELPSDAEPFIPEDGDFSHLHGAGVYALRLSRPDDLAAAWDQRFETRPDYWETLNDADGVVYVGAASDVLRRLEEHRDGEVRKARLVEVCTIDSLRNIWWFDAVHEAFERENGLALMMKNQYPSLYVHSR